VPGLVAAAVLLLLLLLLLSSLSVVAQMCYAATLTSFFLYLRSCPSYSFDWPQPVKQAPGLHCVSEWAAITCCLQGWSWNGDSC